MVEGTEEGIEVWARTVVEIKKRNPVKPPVVDRAFLLVVRHVPSGAVLFLDKIGNPSK